MEIKTINTFISQLESMLAFMKNLAETKGVFQKNPENEEDRLREITELRILCKSKDWPEAVDADFINQNSFEDKVNQASNIISTLVTSDIIDKKVLDFGTGSGYLPFVIANLFFPQMAIGFDLKDNKWNDFEKMDCLKYTTNWQDVIDMGPYDVIILNDVIDHCENINFNKIKSIKSESGRVFVRCHPWCSRNGAHAYKDLNKAFIHLVFNEEELLKMGIKTQPVQKLFDPIQSYKKLFADAGLSILRENINKRDVEFFFIQNPTIQKRIKEKWMKSTNPEFANGDSFPKSLLEIESIDFTLM